MHPRVSLNTLSLGDGSFANHVERATRLGAAAIGPGIEEVAEGGAAAAARIVRDAGLTVATLTHRAFGYSTADEAEAARDRLDGTTDVAATIGAQTITLTTGGRGPLPWRDAATRFAEAIAPCAVRARAAGVTLSLESTSHLYADASIAHRLTDTVAIAAQAGIGVGIDLFACWFDADIEQAIADAAPHLALVQVSDHVAGDRGLPCRAVPGDGMVPLDRLIPAIEATGYRGFYDLEVIGPRLVAEGFAPGLTRGAAAVASWLRDGN